MGYFSGMKRVWVLVLGLLIASPLIAAESNDEGDTAWAEVVKNSKPPTPPAEWNTKAPTPEEMAAFKRKAGDAAEQLADRTKKFYETYPNHPKASEARQKEKTFRQQATALRAVKEEKPTQQTGADAQSDGMDPAFKEKYLEAMSRIRAARKDGPPAVLAELEKAGRELSKEFPKQSEPWEMLFTVAQNSDGTNAIALFKEVAANAPDARMKDAAAGQLKSLDRVNKPLALAFKSTEGADIDVSKMKGKVVLIDFWATWCGPCIAELPNVKKAYEELHPEGFEIIGISFDEDCDKLKSFVAKNKMPWAQFCDGGGWQNAINKEFGIRGIPAMYLVDKKGVLRDMNARDNLAGKVRALLKE
jgi:thiol-disulfide isomerase/thioredoxin